MHNDFPHAPEFLPQAAQPNPRWAPQRLLLLSASLVLGIVMLATLGFGVLRSQRLMSRPQTGALVAGVPSGEADPAQVGGGGQAAPRPYTARARPFTPSVETTETSTTYAITGTTEAEMRSALYEGGPTLQDGRNSIAMTSYQLSVEWKAHNNGATCEITQAVVHLDTTYTLPEWQPAGEAPPELAYEWQRFSDFVVAHEAYHGEIAFQCAERLASRIEAGGGWPDCGTMQAWIDTAVDEIYAECEQMQQAFDAEHGRTSFPLPAGY